jgi:CelD/BcsL family acetyltransferase involved in cellulose biosynthesis
MTLAAAIGARTADAPARSRASRIVSVDLLFDLVAAEPIWRGFEAEQHVATPYQRFDLLKPWQREVGACEHAEPCIAIARDGERRPLLLLPLARRRQHGIRTLSFMGGKHTTFNMPLWDRHFIAEADDLDALVAGLREHDAADVLALTRQPLRWRGLANPMAMLPHQDSVNACPTLAMAPEAPPAISSSFRKRLKGKERKLQALPGYRYHVAASDVDISRLLDWFFQVKPLRMAEQGLPNVFADRGIADFVRAACMTRLAGGNRVIDIHALECDEEIIALFAGVADGHRFSMMFNTYTMSEHSRFSPGLILMRNIIDHYSARGYRALDLGIGSDDYKRMFCKDDEPVFDSFIPLNGRGRIAAITMSVANRAKHMVKHNQRLFHLAQALRAALRRNHGKPSPIPASLA